MESLKVRYADRHTQPCRLPRQLRTNIPLRPELDFPRLIVDGAGLLCTSQSGVPHFNGGRCFAAGVKVNDNAKLVSRPSGSTRCMVNPTASTLKPYSPHMRISYNTGK
jgi:hypothetical protein